MMGSATTPSWTLERLAEMAGGRIEPARVESSAGSRSAPATIEIEGVSIDTRTIRKGDLFVPLPGQHADGHGYVDEAFRRGAAASLLASDRLGVFADRDHGPLVVVEDVTNALQRLAHQHRQEWSGRLVAVTGSTGKTTTKDLLARALGAAMTTLKTEGNLNNHWGAPLTLLRLAAEHRAAVIEMGSNHPGEIALLARLAEPQGGVITNAGSAHIEYFGSDAGIAREKAALGFAIPSGGWLVAGAESTALMQALQGIRCRLVTFGFSDRADVHPLRLDDRGPQGLILEVRGFPPLRLSLIGRHQALNAMAALAVAREFSLDPVATVSALETVRAAGGRMEVKERNGARLLVDCYNANPESTQAALDSLATWSGATRRIAVLGDMLELGEHAAGLHRRIGASVRDAELWAIGRFAEDYAAGARSAGVPVQVFPDRDRLAVELEKVLKPGVVVLLKASRGAALEGVLDALEPRGREP